MLGLPYYIFYTNVECSVKHVACLRSLKCTELNSMASQKEEWL